MTLILKNAYIDRLDETINKYRNTYHRVIKMKPVYVNPSMYIDFNKENNMEGPKFEVGNYIRILKQIHFCKKLCSKLAWRSFCD